ncbi:histidine kinase dimerization/phospho-acceptor domain-containing protein, partial [Cobetia sp. SIMBA_158]|uniref:histidine kinase dimerization/phospho-acceptor domain-containing protein n=1 Tax=Cobetia sp. SIMBA_158 TaxID=3081617 RepID=UPI00398168EE
VMLRDVTRLYRLEEMRRDFVANGSHELRTPLTVLAGDLETYSDYADDLPPRWQRGLGQMQRQTDRMQHLVEDLLTQSRLETDELSDNGRCID